jgi:hypothetical protein
VEGVIREGVKRAPPRFLVVWFEGGWGGGGGLKIETWGKGEASVAGRDWRVVAAMPRGRPLTSLVVGEAAGRVRERQLCAKEVRERERERERVQELHNTTKKKAMPPPIL